MRLVALHLLLSGCVAAGAVTGDGIRLPVEPAKPAPPAPMPGAVSKLPADSLYVIDSDVEVLVLASPQGVVSVSQDTGPLKIRGKFVDGTGGVETRTYKGKQVYVVEAAKTGRVELLVVPVGSKVPADVVRRTLDVEAGQGPIPPPLPDPKPKPDPKPDPKPEPAKVEKAWVVVVEDAAAARTVETAKVLNDPFWQALRPKHDWRHYPSDSKTAIDNGYAERAKGVGYPAVLILDAKDGDLLRAFKLATVADLETQLKAVTK